MACVGKLGRCQCCNQQPLNEPSTLSVSHMVLRATACPPALLSMARSLSGPSWAWRGHSHSMQIDVMKMPHSHPITGTQTTVPCTRKEKIATTQLPSSHIDTRPCFPPFSLFLFIYSSFKCLAQRLTTIQCHLKIFKPTK